MPSTSSTVLVRLVAVLLAATQLALGAWVGWSGGWAGNGATMVCVPIGPCPLHAPACDEHECTGHTHGIVTPGDAHDHPDCACHEHVPAPSPNEPQAPSPNSKSRARVDVVDARCGVFVPMALICTCRDWAMPRLASEPTGPSRCDRSLAIRTTRLRI